MKTKFLFLFFLRINIKKHEKELIIIIFKENHARYIY